MSSNEWLYVSQILCALTVLAAAVSAFVHFRQATRPPAAATAPDPRTLAARLMVLCLLGALGTTVLGLWRKWIEVNHFPSQTMGEVLTVFCAALLLSMVVLHYAMGLQRRGPGWAVLDDVLVLLVGAGGYLTIHYVWTLVTAQRDLPPALQSYWFAPHIIALIFSYATLGIAGLLCLVYFASRFWSGVLGEPGAGRRALPAAELALAITAGSCAVLFWLAFAGPEWASAGWLYALELAGTAAMIALLYRLHRAGRLGGPGSRKTFASLALIFAGSALLPFGHFVTLPVLLVCGVVFFGLRVRGLLPRGDFLVRMEKQMDEVSFSAFSVGFPFLTAGVFMGAFWAQEAWANYWGWDSKENSALISWLIYVIYIHVRMLGGFRGERAMAVLAGGALSVFMTFQVFGYLPDSQSSMHKYTDDSAVPKEGQQGGGPDASARAESSDGSSGEEPR